MTETADGTETGVRSLGKPDFVGRENAMEQAERNLYYH